MMTAADNDLYDNEFSNLFDPYVGASFYLLWFRAGR